MTGSTLGEPGRSGLRAVRPHPDQGWRTLCMQHRPILTIRLNSTSLGRIVGLVSPSRKVMIAGRARDASQAQGCRARGAGDRVLELPGPGIALDHWREDWTRRHWGESSGRLDIGRADGFVVRAKIERGAEDRARKADGFHQLMSHVVGNFHVLMTGRARRAGPMDAITVGLHKRPLRRLWTSAIFDIADDLAARCAHGRRAKWSHATSAEQAGRQCDDRCGQGQ